MPAVAVREKLQADFRFRLPVVQTVSAISAASDATQSLTDLVMQAFLVGRVEISGLLVSRTAATQDFFSFTAHSYPPLTWGDVSAMELVCGVCIQIHQDRPRDCESHPTP